MSAPDGTVLDRPDTNTTDGDHDRFSHYVRKVDLERALLEGIPCQALCGKFWLPSKDHTKFPVCAECKAIFDGLPKAPPSEN